MKITFAHQASNPVSIGALTYARVEKLTLSDTSAQKAVRAMRGQGVLAT